MAEIASPKATGGKGPAFEFKVQAAFLATMLVNGRYPCLPDGQAQFVRFQARQLGYLTDDLFVRLQTPAGTWHRLLAQVKADITFTKGNKDFRETVVAAWTDFTNTGLFDRDKDLLLIVSGPGSKGEIRHFRPLLNMSRSSVSAEEYFTKVSTPNFVSEDTRRFLAAIEDLLTEYLGTEPGRDELWRFLKCLHWLSFDFDEPSSRDLAMIQTMLRLGMKADVGISPEDVWARLLRTAMDYDPQGGSLTRESLIAEVGDCIADSRVTRSTGLQRLAEHAEAILAVVRTIFLDGTHLDRSWLAQALWNILSQQRLLLISGVAGIGKSAVIKEMLNSFAMNIPTFILKADELDRSHFHQVLTEIGVGESIHELSSRFGLIENKIFIIESLEKLLEADSLDAFHQLLHFVLNDPSWMVVLSCRSYALGTIRNEILIPQSISPPLIDILCLADFELQEIASDPGHAGPARLLRNESLKEILRVPMYLSYACSLDWEESTDSLEHLDVGQFERLLWANIIRKEKQRSGGVHLRREQCFTRLAVARARSMTPFVPADSLDAAALQLLEADDLIIRTEEGVAPAHDLFEEWAINRHVDALYREHRDDLARLFDAIGAEPAMRRGFRAWLTRHLERQDSSETADFITNISQNEELPGFWRDEAIVSVLLSSQAQQYFAAQQNRLLDNSLKQFMRIVHLLRTACKEPDIGKMERLPLTAAGRGFLGTLFLKPSGTGWSAALDFLSHHLSAVGLAHAHSIAGLLQDWVNGLDPDKALTHEARKVGLTALHLLDLTRGTCDEDLRTEVLRIAFRVSSAIKEELALLFDETLNIPVHEDDEVYAPYRTVRAPNPDRYRFNESIRKAALESFFSVQLCASMPDAVAALAKRHWLRPSVSHAEDRRSRRELSIEPDFGMRRDLHFEMHPPSALQGPFLSLLKFHPQQGIDLIVELINSSSEHYARSGLDSPPDEPIPQVSVRLNDGREVSQYLSWRLWAAYRGLTVMPPVLESALMALEKWLLDLVKEGEDITGFFDQLLSRSRSCAVSAVLAGVAVAHPEKLGEHLLPLLRTKVFFALDTARMIGEQSLLVDVGAAMGLPYRGLQRLHIDERKEAQQLPHRKRDLEGLVRHLQTGPLRETVQLIIDEHHKNLPPLESQTDGDRIWRLALHRMDLRQYRIEEVEKEDQVVIIQLPPEPDIQEMHARLSPEIQHDLEFSSVTMWARHEFDHGPAEQAIFEDWKVAVAWARNTYRELSQETEEEGKTMWLAGPIYIAALSIRDHLAELDSEEIGWCSRILMEKVFRGLSIDPRLADLHRGITDGTAAAAEVLPLLFGLVGADTEELRLAIAGSLTYPEPGVRTSAIRGAHRTLWPHHHTLAKSCLHGMLESARLSERQRLERLDSRRDRDFQNYREKEEALREKYLAERQNLRKAMARGELAGDFDCNRLTFGAYSIHDLVPVVQMLPVDKERYHSEPLLTRLIELTLKAAREEEADQHNRGELPFQFKTVLNDLVSFYALKHEVETARRICAPIAACIEDCPEYVAEFVESLIANEDKEHAGAHFWKIWHLFADPVFAAERLDGKYLRYRDQQLMKTLMLATVHWKLEAKEWKTLSENPHHLEVVCRTACKTKAGFEGLLNLLYTVGRIYLPRAFTWLADALPDLKTSDLFNDKNNRFALETLLHREILSKATEIRGNPGWQKGVLALLDILVDFGSSTAFQLRERIVRPPKRK